MGDFESISRLQPAGLSGWSLPLYIHCLPRIPEAQLQVERLLGLARSWRRCKPHPIASWYFRRVGKGCTLFLGRRCQLVTQLQRHCARPDGQRTTIVKRGLLHTLLSSRPSSCPDSLQRPVPASASSDSSGTMSPVTDAGCGSRPSKQSRKGTCQALRCLSHCTGNFATRAKPGRYREATQAFSPRTPADGRSKESMDSSPVRPCR